MLNHKNDNVDVDYNQGSASMVSPIITVDGCFYNSWLPHTILYTAHIIETFKLISDELGFGLKSTLKTFAFLILHTRYHIS